MVHRRPQARRKPQSDIELGENTIDSTRSKVRVVVFDRPDDHFPECLVLRSRVGEKRVRVIAGEVHFFQDDMLVPCRAVWPGEAAFDKHFLLISAKSL